MSDEEFWFSHREKRYEVTGGKLKWTDQKEIWDWDQCTIDLARTLKKELIVIVRSKTRKSSRFMGKFMQKKWVELRFMYAFGFETISEPRLEEYTARMNHKDPDKREGAKQRWVLQLDDDYWIWDWVEEGEFVPRAFQQLYDKIVTERASQSIMGDNIIKVALDMKKDKIIPVIYQSAVDSLDNFVREVHCAETPAGPDGSYEIEVTIIFNNEELRKHAYGGILNKIYEYFRRLKYGRKLDVESFKIMIRKNIEDNTFIFENIYSGGHQLEDDSIHGDPPTAPERMINYYFMDHNHPVVFINTSNHAMAGHDTNHRLWKWEYISLTNNAPIKYDDKTREQIEKGFKPLFK